MESRLVALQQRDPLRLLDAPFFEETRHFDVVLAKVPTEWNEDFAFMTVPSPFDGRKTAAN